jgi:hypothetical protein
MAWDDAFGGDAESAGRDEEIELVGPNLRVTGSISLGRFGRLTDLINASSGYLRIRQACLLERSSGKATDLMVSELMVDQDEISFIAQTHPPALEEEAAGGFETPTFDTGVDARQAREFVLFTPAHTVTGKIYIFGQTDLAAFVDSTSPRFVPVVEVTTRSLADRAVVTKYDFVLINRTQMIAAAEVGGEPETAEMVTAEAAPVATEGVPEA